MKAELVPVAQQNVQITMTPAQASTLAFITGYSRHISESITMGSLDPRGQTYASCQDVLSAIHGILDIIGVK